MTLRTSSYTIFIELADDSGDVLIAHGYSGAYDCVSADVARFLRSRQPPRSKPRYGEWGPEPIVRRDVPQPSDSVLARLERRGYLTSLDVAAEEQRFTGVVERLHDNRKAPGYVFMPTYDCNLRCHYCFQDHMRTDPQYAHLLTRMTPELIDRIFAAMPGIESKHGIPGIGTERPRSIMFFGGEPLLEANRSIVEYTMQRARAMGTVEFQAVSNATELHTCAELIGPDGISTIQITFDGPPDEHDRRRIFADGSGSFARIADNIDLVLKRGAKVSVRINVDRNNVDRLPELASAIEAHGWHEAAGFRAYVSPIFIENDKTDPDATFDYWQLNERVSAL